jgi:hypothetical protein
MVRRCWSLYALSTGNYSDSYYWLEGIHINSHLSKRRYLQFDALWHSSWPEFSATLLWEPQYADPCFSLLVSTVLESDLGHTAEIFQLYFFICSHYHCCSIFLNMLLSVLLASLMQFDFFFSKDDKILNCYSPATDLFLTLKRWHPI